MYISRRVTVSCAWKGTSARATAARRTSWSRCPGASRTPRKGGGASPTLVKKNNQKKTCPGLIGALISPDFLDLAKKVRQLAEVFFN